MAGRFCQVLCHGADAGADLQHTVIFSHTCRRNDLLQHMGIDQEVLSEFLLEYELVFLKDLYGIFRISQCCHLIFPFCK